MKTIILCMAIVAPLFGTAQLVQDAIQMEEIDQPKEKEIEKEFQVSLDVTSLTAAFMGANIGSNFHVGLQLKRVFGNTAFRFTGEYYPQSRLNPFFSSVMIEEIAGNEARYLVFNEDGRMLRLGVGAENRKAFAWGQGYAGADVMLIGERIDFATTTYWKNPSDSTPYLPMNWNYMQVNSVGVGLAPFIGFEFQPWKHLGFNLEATLDAMFMTGEGYNFNRETAVLSPGLRHYYFTWGSGLINARIHYRF